MSDDRPENEDSVAPEDSSAPDAVVDGPGFEPRAGLAWQFPAIAVSLLAIAAAVLFRRPEPSPPDFAGELAHAREAIAIGDLDLAAVHLGLVEAGLAGRPDLLGDYHLAVADHRAASLRPLLTSPAAQASQVVEAYERATHDGASLDLDRRRTLAEAMVAAGRDRDALDLLEELEPSLDPVGREEIRTLRHDLRRADIDRRLASGTPADSVVDEVARLLAEDTSLEIEAWATALDARLRLETGQVDGLARGLGLAMHRLEGRSEDSPWASIDWATLWVLLGHAYRDELGATDRAAECYGIALDRLRAIGRIAAEASLSLGDLGVGRVRASASDGRAGASELSDAASRYDAVLGMADADLDQKLDARIGLAAIDLLRDDHEAAIAGLDRVAALLERSSLVSDAVRMRAVAVALDGAERAMLAAVSGERIDEVMRLDAAADHAMFVRRFAAEQERRHRGLELLAAARERAAALLLEPVLGGDDPRADRAIAVVPVETRLESARRFAAAAEALDEIEADLTGDDADRFTVLWRAAVLHDKAGAVEAALSRYVRFVESQSTEASLWPEAAFRVAAGHHALYDLDGAETWYRRLLVTMGDGRDEVSEYTTRAKVGLARVLIEQGTEVALGESETLLNEVLDGTARDAVEPAVPEYRGALLHLVRLLAGSGRWNEVAGRGEEWLGRYPADERWGEMAVRTGEGLLRHAEALTADAAASDAMNPSLAAAREDERRRSLRLAGVRLQAGVSELDRRGGEDLDPLESSLLRAGSLHRAMVADRLGDAEASIRLYREAEQRFAGEPVAVVALISMADVAARVGDRETAARATARARKRLEHLHRDAEVGGPVVDPLGPELLLGPGRETIDRWITAFPPGVEEEIG